ncbi:DsbA family oxidoreductase [uncultured Bartonella sp.]|uniref:DsbA family oxidoreductase n=1 Tax=uncultured Bartonella sp. TaxID=104108 RepID=UPI002625A7CB|nr:DsbA family oxidoreductase [uncultured Bartonella sp.]
MNSRTIYINMISDLVCPWCFIGRNRLIKAIKCLPEIEVKLRWTPFQLYPDLPAEGVPYQLHMKKILGSQNAIDETERTLIELGKQEEIEFDFASIKTEPNSLDAQRVVYWAAQDKERTQDKLIVELFSRFFEQGQNIGNHAVLVEAAGKAGMRADVVEKLLQTPIDKDTVKQDCAHAYHIGVRGIPCFIIDQKYVVMGAQPVEVLTDAIKQIADGFEPGSAQDR